jgi:uncharacterized protein
MRPSLGLLVLLLLASCGTSPKSRFYALESVPGVRIAEPVSGPPIVVDAVHLPDVLDRLPLVRRAGPTQLQISDTDRWAAPLDEMSRRVLAWDLAARLPTGLVVAPDAPKPPGAVRALVVSVEEFDADAAGQVRLDAVWTLLAGSPQKPVLERRETIRVGGADGFASEPAAMSRALGVLADRIASALRPDAPLAPSASVGPPPSRKSTPHANAD